MGDITLGCLLGAPGGSMSFDVASRALTTSLGSWSLPSTVAGYTLAGAAAGIGPHRSPQQLHVQVPAHGGSGSTLLAYDHATADDAWARAFPQVATHALRVDLWHAAPDAVASGQLAWQLLGQPDAAALLPATGGTHQPLRLETWATSAGGGPGLRVAHATDVASAWDWLLDDVLTQLDVLTLHPDWPVEVAWQPVGSPARTSAGRQVTVARAHTLHTRLELSWLTDSAAGLLNWWWSRQLPLVLTLDTSDAEAQYIVQITNGQQPAQQRRADSPDHWRGALQLQSINDGALVF